MVALCSATDRQAQAINVLREDVISFARNENYGCDIKTNCAGRAKYNKPAAQEKRKK